MRGEQSQKEAYGDFPSPAPSYLRALNLACNIAKDLNHGYVGTEHLLLGALLQIPEGILTNKEGERIGIDRIRSCFEFNFGMSDRIVLGEIKYTLGVKRVIWHAIGFVRNEGRSAISAVDILRGIVREEESQGATILELCEFDLKQLDQQLQELPQE